MRVIAFSGNLGSGKDTAAERVITTHGFTRISLADPLKRLGWIVFGFSYDQLWGPSDDRNALDERYTMSERPEDVGTPWDGVLSEEWQYAEDRLRIEGRKWVEDDLCAFVGNMLNADQAHERLMAWFYWLRENHPNLSPRIMLQTLGTEYGRDALYRDIWLDIALATAKKLLSGKPDEDGLVAERYINVTGLFYGNGSHWRATGVVIPDVRFPNELKGIHDAGGKIVRVIRPETDDAATGIGVANHASENSLQEMPDSEYDVIIVNDKSLEEFYEAVDVAAGVTMMSR